MVNSSTIARRVTSGRSGVEWLGARPSAAFSNFATSAVEKMYGLAR